MIKLNGGSVKNPRKYSKSERLLFKFVPKSGAKITSEELVRRRKEAENWSIANPRNVVITQMRSLIEKIDGNREPFRLKKSPQLGPYPIEYWIEK